MSRLILSTVNPKTCLKLSEPRLCEECGDVMLTRRITCKRCGLKVCTWCYHHIHALYMGSMNPPACAGEVG